MTPEQITLAMNVLTTIVTNLVTLAPIAVPFILAWRSNAHDSKQQTVEADVKRAGLIAASIAADEIRNALSDATKPDSDGGATITQSEQKAALARGVKAGIEYLKCQNLYSRAVDVYGSALNVEASIAAIVHAKAPDAPLAPVVALSKTELAPADKPADQPSAQPATPALADPSLSA